MKPLTLLLIAGCTRTGTDKARIEPTFVTVEVSGELGSEDAPLPFSTAAQSWTVTATTLDKEGDPYPFEGDLKIRVRPGRLDMDPWVTLTGGTWTGEVPVYDGFGPTRIWFSDEGDKDVGSTRQPSWATGVSEPLWYERPTIAELQKNDDIDTNNLEGEFAELRVADRSVVVTALATTGFWVTDLADAAGSYNSLFVYTFNAPSGAEVGDQLSSLNGGDNEYLGSTQLSWPTWELAGTTLTPPDPVVLDTVTACDETKMEGLEASLVEVPDATIPSTFVEGSEDYDNWVQYGQWPVTFGDGSCTIYVESETAAPDFSAAAHVGETLGTLRGMVSEIWGVWIILPRDASDIGADGAAARPRVPLAAGATQRASIPRPRPPRAPSNPATPRSP